MSEKPFYNSEDGFDWLEIKNKDLVGSAVSTLGKQAILEALQRMAKNFTPEECADIILEAFKGIVEDPRTRSNIISWVNKNQSSHTKTQ
ncbi:MAG: hypothetical protein H0X31_01755 [Nostocaceae cyanobacterium]|nr:hypothetical protein [Nostocaceae cyanobacterium]